jgi:hypothetical protein
VIVTGIVAEGVLEPPEPEPELDPLPLLPDELDELCATGLTRVIFPFTVLPSGSWTVTASPSTASVCLVASSWTVTTSWVEVVWRIGSALAPAAEPEPEPADEDPPPDEKPDPADADPPPREPPPDAAPPPPEEDPRLRSSAVSAFSSAVSALSCAAEVFFELPLGPLGPLGPVGPVDVVRLVVRLTNSACEPEVV